MKEERKQRFTWTLIFSVAVFIIMLLAVVAAGIIVALIDAAGVFEMLGWIPMNSTWLLILTMVIISQLLGMVITFFFIRIPLGPVNTLTNAMGRLARGDYSVRVEPDWIFKRMRGGPGLAESFNSLATELESTEMLRSDFVNNFSHEFKTPIVSIAGFAKLLKRVDLPEEQRQEYLKVIEEESLRLSQMATNVLSLTKVENQSILSDRSKFNIAEQLRNCVLMLESKWGKKDIDLDLDLKETDILANEELLKQVWINLLDNAIKFVPDYGEVKIQVLEEQDHIKVIIANSGPEIPPEERQKIFRKFYQADSSHATQGNGVGLAIVKRVVQLHKGTVEVDYERGMNRFIVCLPVK